jgi:hypothetical protein
VKPYRFSTTSWELKTIVQEIGELVSGRDKPIDDGEDTVTKYLTLGNRIKALEVKLLPRTIKSFDLSSVTYRNSETPWQERSR